MRTFVQLTEVENVTGLSLWRSKQNSVLTPDQVVLNFQGPRHARAENGPGDFVEVSGFDLQLDFNLALSVFEGLAEILAEKRALIVEKIAWSKRHGDQDSTIVINRTRRYEELLEVIDKYSAVSV